ncbi:MAG TPA: acyl-CoA dehydrogenase [Beijerinckiaceae bacterium]|jgi:alkylation response protein AidB-like acyl-CoA dehydrogenase|nr:acyl-CoA dehydrogenase [Beijerinckiaceae bacterium]
MTYRVPVSDMIFTMDHAAGLAEGVDSGLYAELADGIAQATLEEAAKLAEGVLTPLNRTGDLQGARLKDGVVTTTPGWREAYKQWSEGGWNGVTASEHHGGMGLPVLLGVACTEIWNSANMAFALCPLLNFGAVEAVEAHANDGLKALYLDKMVSGEWTGTMNLTEPQAGSDLNAVRSRAEPVGDGTYKIFGQKIFITYGEHDLTDNIIHLVLARLPDAPPGTRGISLFLVPKFLLDENGKPGKRNDVHCAGIEHKLGVHGSPTCTMVFGDEGGAIGWLVGGENRGLNCMFTMMNNARLSVGMQGVAIAERATQHAVAYARERKQGRAPGAKGSGMSSIAEHPDVRRMLMTMKAQTAAARVICYMTAASIDRAKRESDAAARKQAGERASLLTPVAKAYSTDIGNEVASIGVQVHGGMGFIEETGAAQFMRDIRIGGIYEGTNGIQAIDLVQRKVPLSGGDAVKREIADMRETLARLREANTPDFGHMHSALSGAVDAFARATDYMLEAIDASLADALAGAAPYLRLFGYARGGTGLAEIAMAAHGARVSGETDPAHAGRIAVARFFAENIATGASGLERTVTEGAGSVHGAELALAG